MNNKTYSKNLVDISEDYYFSLQETFLSFFEKNSLIYIKDALKADNDNDIEKLNIDDRIC